MNFRDHVRKDTASWPAELRSKWADVGYVRGDKLALSELQRLGVVRG